MEISCSSNASVVTFPTVNKRPYFRQTTAQQRRLLFQTWEETNNINFACQKARVSRGTFYHWKPRFLKEGYTGLEQTKSHTPNTPYKIEKEVAERVVKLYQQNPTWGKRRIAGELAKENFDTDWLPLASPNTIKRILKEAGLWPEPEPKKTAGKIPLTKARTAEKPRQTVNVDLCFVPATHEVEQKLPAVSGSSGRLVIENLTPKTEPQWPGRVFENKELPYGEAMEAFVSASKESNSKTVAEEVSSDPNTIKTQKKVLRLQEEELRKERRIIRAKRKQEDVAWKQIKSKRKKQQDSLPKKSNQKRKAQDKQWKELKKQRQETSSIRSLEDEQWRAKRLNIREAWSQLPIVTSWIAILVVVDNCTRQCLGLPLFSVGQKVTAAMVVEALQILLPPELQFLISDRGVHFTSKVFQLLASTEDFVHVLTARHRPQSNGIAERFVRTLKEWLKDKSWEDDQKLMLLLADFIVEYNDRPHQGINNISPNKLTSKLCLTSS